MAYIYIYILRVYAARPYNPPLTLHWHHVALSMKRPPGMAEEQQRGQIEVIKSHETECSSFVPLYDPCHQWKLLVAMKDFPKKSNAFSRCLHQI